MLTDIGMAKVVVGMLGDFNLLNQVYFAKLGVVEIGLVGGLSISRLARPSLDAEEDWRVSSIMEASPSTSRVLVVKRTKFTRHFA